MGESSLKKQAVSGVIWTFSQQFSLQVINFIVQVILARILSPEMFGLIAMLTIFISIGQTLMDGGMTNSLIRTKNPDQLDYSTVFMANMAVSVATYSAIFFFSPLIATFYNQEILESLLKVYALSFVIRAFVAVHVARLTKEMNFKTQMRLQIPSTIVGAIVGIVMAYKGYGVWSLVWLNLSQTIFFTIQNWLFIKWRPSLVFNLERFKYHFNFGYKMTLSGLLDIIYNNAYRIVIGKLYSPKIVGFYNQAETMRLFPVLQISTVMNKVTYPLFSNLHDDIQLKEAYRRTMKLVLFVTVPIMLALILNAKEIFSLLFGEKWLSAVPYFQILAIGSIVRPVSSYNLNILKVKGRSDVFLKVEVVKKFIGVVAIVISIPIGIDFLIISSVIIAYLSLFINMFYSGSLINYPVIEQMADTYIIYLAGIFCYGLSFFVKGMISIPSDLLVIILICLFSAVVYLALIYFFDRGIFKIIKNIIK